MSFFVGCCIIYMYNPLAIIFFQQFTGINVVMLQKATKTTKEDNNPRGFLLVPLIGLINFLATWGAYYFVDSIICQSYFNRNRKEKAIHYRFTNRPSLTSPVVYLLINTKS